MFSLYLQIYRPDFLNGIVDIQLAPTHFINLATNNKDGYRIRLTFRVYGNGDAEAWENLLTVFNGIWKSTERCSSAMTEGASPTFP